jgi:hypothetical protein|tara:strand:- start:403 stop:591 length:189 start_codon:yes stop_codon:yes gene_type:complete
MIKITVAYENKKPKHIFAGTDESTVEDVITQNFLGKSDEVMYLVDEDVVEIKITEIPKRKEE